MSDAAGVQRCRSDYRVSILELHRAVGYTTKRSRHRSGEGYGLVIGRWVHGRGDGGACRRLDLEARELVLLDVAGVVHAMELNRVGAGRGHLERATVGLLRSTINLVDRIGHAAAG